MPRNSLAFLGLLATGLLAVACSSSSSSSSTTTGTTGSGGSGGSSTTTTTATTGTGGAGGASTTTTTTTTTGTGGAGGAAAGACTNEADLAIVMSKDVAGITGQCGKENFGAEPKTSECIKTGTGLSDACVACFAGTVKCVVEKCLNDCLADANSQACKDCRAANCDPAFEACSGLPSSNQ
jgi:hypothetical protein